MYKVWHLIWRHEHVRWSRCVEALRVQLLIPLWPTKVYTQPDYMSGLVSPAEQALGCSRGVASYFSLHVISWEFCFQLVSLGMITEDSQRLLVSVSMHRWRMCIVPFLFVFWLIESAFDLKQNCPFVFRALSLSSFAFATHSCGFFLQILHLHLSQQPRVSFNRLI